MVSFWPRINTVLLLVTLLTIIGLFATRAFGGPLDPPPGAPAPTDGVRGPGTPISSLPFTISEAGYYYVTRDLSVAEGQDGITICCSNVTIDLGGFTISGGNTPGGPIPHDGIANPGARNIVIRNGAVRGWSIGINLGGTYSRVERVHALSNQNIGIVVGPGSVISDCNASLNGSRGIVADHATVRNCTMSENSIGIEVQNNSLVEGNRASSNSGNGIYITGTRNMIVDNQLSGNVQPDVIVGFGASYNVLTGNVYCTATDDGTFTSAGIGNWC